MLQKTKLTNSSNDAFDKGGRAPSGPGFGDHLFVSTDVAFFIAWDRLD
jgi:hypothetical protein